ncbi:MAG: hypothetical protein GY953_06725, partial [bacterium]|nr:hypothetical protein [bacterium]
SDRLGREKELLSRLENILSQHSAARTRVEESESLKTEWTADLERLQISGPDQPPPYSVMELDALRDDLEDRQERSEAFAVAVAAQQVEVVEALAELKRREREHRQALEAERSETDADDPTALAFARRVAELQEQLVRERVHLRRTELRRESLARDLHGLRLQTTEAKIGWMARSVRFPQSDLEAR